MPQPADLFYTTTKKTEETVLLGFTLFSLELYCAGKNVPGGVKMVLRPKNEDGSWNMDAEPKGFHIEDKLMAPTSDPTKYLASLVQQLILTGHATADSALAVANNLVGMNMVQCSQILTPVITGVPNENPELAGEGNGG